MQEPDFDATYAGNVTAAVTPQPPAPPSAFMPPSVRLDNRWTIHKVADLVRDLAMNLYDEPTILAKHGLTAIDFDVIKKNKFFQNALEQETIAWNSPQSTTRRLALEAAMAVENALPTVAARLTNSNEPLADVVSLLKVLSEIAGAIGSKANVQSGPAASQFKITINLGGESTTRDATPTITIDHQETLNASP